MSDDSAKRIIENTYGGDEQKSSRQPREMHDPVKDRWNTEAAYYADKPGVFEKAIGSVMSALGAQTDPRRALTPWSVALKNTLGSQSIANMVQDLGHAERGAREGRRDPETVLGLANAPVLGGFTAAATKSIPKGALGSIPAEAPRAQPKAPYVRKLDNLGLYSKAVEEAHNLKIKSGTPEQMINALLKQGVKPEELYWMGLADRGEKGKMLPSQRLLDFVEASGGNGKISKDDMVLLAEENRVRPEKTVRKGSFDEDAAREAAYDDAITRVEEEFSLRPAAEEYIDRYVVEPDPEAKSSWRVVDESLLDDPDAVERGHHIVSSGYRNEEVAQAAAKNHAADFAEDVGHYGIYRGDELMESLPDISRKKAQSLFEEVKSEEARRLAEDADLSQYDSGGKHLQYLDDRPGGEDAGQNYRETIYSTPQEVLDRRGQKPFERSHYPEHGNVFGHWLLHDYTDAATNKGVTFANEGQSDWRKALTKYGEAQPPDVVKLLEKAYDEARVNHERIKEPIWAEPGNNGEIEYWRVTNPQQVALAHEYSQARQKLMANARLAEQQRAGRGNMALPGAPRPDWDSKLGALASDMENAKGRMRDAGVKQLVGDEKNAWEAARDAAALRATEAQNAYRQAQMGVPQGPFVGDQSAANRFLAKQLLIEAARDKDSGFAAWSSPDIIADRWTESLRPTYEKAIPETMLKLAREHDPDAKLSSVHIGDYDGSKMARYATADEHIPEQLQFPGFSKENPAAPGVEVFAQERPVDIMMGPWGNAESVRPSVLDGSTPRPAYWLTNEHGRRVGGYAGFQSRAAAENALAALQRRFDNPQTLADMAQIYDLAEVPAIAMTDKMRRSILEKGFPMFVNPPTAALPGLLLDNAYGQTPPPERE